MASGYVQHHRRARDDLLTYREIADHLKRRGWTVEAAYGKWIKARNADRELVLGIAPEARAKSANGTLHWHVMSVQAHGITSPFRTLKELDGLLG